MASMRSDMPLKAWLVQRNRKRRIEAAANPPTPPTPDTLAWVDAPPATGTINTNYTASWKGGVHPYYAEIKSSSIILNEQTGSYPQIVMNVDGTNQPAGVYTWTVRDAAGTEITGTTTIS